MVNKNKNGKYVGAILLGIWIGFMTAVTVTIFVPELDIPAVKILCANGEHHRETLVEHPYAGSEVTSFYEYCKTAGVDTEISGQVIGLSILIYSVLFAGLMVILKMLKVDILLMKFKNRK